MSLAIKPDRVQNRVQVPKLTGIIGRQDQSKNNGIF